MKFAIGSTKAGLTLKEGLIEYLENQGHTVDDLGMKRDGDFVPYYESAANAARAVSEGKYEKGIIICGTGAGSVIVANKFKGVYAVYASNQFEASKAKIVNDANVLCLGEWLTPNQHGIEIVKSWLGAEFGEGFEPEWVDFLRNGCDEVKKIENQNLK